MEKLRQIREAVDLTAAPEVMTQVEIIGAHEALDYMLAELQEQHQAKVAVIKAEIKVLQSRCKHPNKQRYSDYSGDSWSECPDCGGK